MCPTTGALHTRWHYDDDDDDDDEEEEEEEEEKKEGEEVGRALEDTGCHYVDGHGSSTLIDSSWEVISSCAPKSLDQA